MNGAHHDPVLIDDQGGAYTFVEPDEDPSLPLEEGSSLEGTLAFLGPIDPDASELTLLVNVSTDEVDDYDPDDRSDGPVVNYSEFVVDGISVEWE